MEMVSIAPTSVTAADEERMREVCEFTARTLKTSRPVPFGALIVNTKTGKRLMIATNAVMGLVEPMMNGIGGDLFAIMYDAKANKLYGLNASGWAPKALCSPVTATCRMHSSSRLNRPVEEPAKHIAWHSGDDDHDR